MDPREIIEIFDDDDDDEEPTKDDAEQDLDRRAILTPYITRVVDALGGYEGDEYKLGDEVYGCLKDLKKLWRKDDTDDDRTVARIFYESRVLANDLIPILLVTAGQGLVEDKRAIACADLMTAMTWPIDMAEELKEIDDEIDERADYTQLLESHLHYKATLLKSDVMKALFGIVLPPLAKNRKERQERDGQIINVVLHLIRNLAFIKDLPPNSTRSADNVELSSLQSKLVRLLEETHILQLLLTIAANTDGDPLFNNWNTLVLEIFYLLFRGVKPADLAADQAKQTTVNLRKLLEIEERNKREVARKASSRHSRFGTTITVQLKQASTEEGGSRPLVLHRQQAIHGEAGTILDISKKQKAKKGNTVDELAREDNLSIEARTILKQLASDFLDGCFNPFLSALLKDIRAERAKITEKDNLRLLYVTKWFLEYFLAMRTKACASDELAKWSFGLIAEVIERVWIVWVLKRMRESMEEKPKLWTELQAGIECLTQLFLLIDAMSSADMEDPALSEAAELLLHQLIYNGEVLDISLDSLRFYKEGTQSLTYLDSSVHLAYSLLRMLEKWSKKSGDGTYVRQKTSKRKKKRRGSSPVPETEEDGNANAVGSDVDDEDVVHEIIFSFEAFEMKFANADITHTLLTYLGRYREFSSPEKMKRVVSLMHRQAVKAKAEGLFFQVSTLDLFKTILSEQKTLPRDQPYKDLLKLVNFILRQFFKAVEQEPFLTIEVFFPKNRGHWKQFSSWEPEKKPGRAAKNAAGKGGNASTEVVVKKGHTLSEQIGIAVAALVDGGRRDLVVWVQDILRMVVNRRKRVVDEVDQHEEDEEEDGGDEDEAVRERRLANKDASKKYLNPSDEARKKIEEEVIPCVTEDRAEAASKNAYLKLLFRLCKFMTREQGDDDEDDDELEWYIPHTLMPTNLDTTRTIIIQYLETPFEAAGGKKLADLLRKKRRVRRRRVSTSVSGSGSDDEGAWSDGDGGGGGGGGRGGKGKGKSKGKKRKEGKEGKKKQRKEKEKQVYKSAQFIVDSDEEYGDMEGFLRRERELRERMIAAAAAAAVMSSSSNNADGSSSGVAGEASANGNDNVAGQGVRPVGMRKTGTKKRKKRKGMDGAEEAGEGGEEKEGEREKTPPRPRPRPKPRAVVREVAAEVVEEVEVVEVVEEEEDQPVRATGSASEGEGGEEEEEEEGPVVKRRAVKRLFLSDSEDED